MPNRVRQVTNEIRQHLRMDLQDLVYTRGASVHWQAEPVTGAVVPVHWNSTLRAASKLSSSF